MSPEISQEPLYVPTPPSYRDIPEGYVPPSEEPISEKRKKPIVIDIGGNNDEDRENDRVRIVRI